MLIVVRSEDRQPGSLSSSDFHVKITPINVKKLTLVYCRIPNSILNVIQGVNDILKIGQGGFDYFIQIQSGLYNATELSDAIESAWASTVGTTCTVSINTNQTFNIACPTSFFVYSDGTINKLLGYSTTTNSATATSVPASYISEINKPESLFLNIRELGTFVNSSNNKMYTFFIPLEQLDATGNFSSKTIPQEIEFPISTTISSLHVELLNDDKNIDLVGSDWEFVLKY